MDKKSAAADFSNVANQRLEEIAPYLQQNGSYVFDLVIKKSEKGALHVRSPHLSFSVAYFGDSGLAGLPGIAESANMSLALNHGIKDSLFYFKKKGTDAYMDGRDQVIGLPEGTDYQIVAVPKGCTWQPSAPAPRETPAGACGILHPPR